MFPTEQMPFLLIVNDSPFRLYSSWDSVEIASHDISESGDCCSIQIFGEEMIEDI